MRLGLIAYSTETGLGIQTYEIYRHLEPAKVLLVDLSKFNGMPTNHNKYSGDVRITDGIPTDADMEWLTDNVDVVFLCETPLNYSLYSIARRKGVKTVQQLNPEFFDYFRKVLPKPSLLAAPSSWMRDQIEALNVAPVEEWRVPINTDLIERRDIASCHEFVHIIGRPSFEDRNGTMIFLEAARRIGNQFKYRIYLQPPTDHRAQEYFKPVADFLRQVQKAVPIQVIKDVPNYQDLYKEGDVLVLPRRYGGLCLPMQEALAAGMPVIMTNCSPNYDRLPKEWLIDVASTSKIRTHTEITLHNASIENLILVMRKFGANTFMRWSNIKAHDLAMANSWGIMKEDYINRLEKLCTSQ